MVDRHLTLLGQLIPEVNIVEIEILAVGEGQGCEFVELQRNSEKLREVREV